MFDFYETLPSFFVTFQDTDEKAYLYLEINQYSSLFGNKIIGHFLTQCQIFAEDIFHNVHH